MSAPSAIVGQYKQPGIAVTDREFQVPLVHDRPDGEQLNIFAREIAAADKADADLPWLVYLRGGPGNPAPRPIGRAEWLNVALKKYRVLLLDQRGTGRSSPATHQTLARLGPAQAQGEYLANFRADSIVRDAELIRAQLTNGAPWSVLGQSFGGFCTVTYLSSAPDGMREAFITGGLPGLTATADDVYRATYPAVAARNMNHYERYPGDAAQALAVARHLAHHDARLPNGARLTVESFQTLGMMLGMTDGSHSLHYLLEDPFSAGELSDAFCWQVQNQLSFATIPLYALLHEAIYTQGAPTNWSAHRVREEFPEFAAGPALNGSAPLFFTGEMIYPATIDTDPALRPLRAAAEYLAQRAGWGRLYDPERLARNEVPAYAAVYYDDMYVDRELALTTARSIKGLRTWITSEYEHDALDTNSAAVLGRLFAMAAGEM